MIMFLQIQILVNQLKMKRFLDKPLTLQWLELFMQRQIQEQKTLYRLATKFQREMFLELENLCLSQYA